MASLRQRNGVWHIQFLWGGRKFERSLHTIHKRHADRLRGRVELQIDSVRQGLLSPPTGVDPVEWIISAGQRETSPEGDSDAVRSLGELLDRYRDAMPAGSRAPNTVLTEKIHHTHLKREIGSKTAVSVIGVETLQAYINKRQPAKSATIKKELASLRVAWRWMNDAEKAPPSPRFDRLKFPKEPSAEPFKHAEEIRLEIRQRRLHGPAAAKLWECLVLTLDEVREIVAFVDALPHRWFADAFAVAAYTGARRSELCRMDAADVDLRRGEIRIREKKRVRDRSESSRHVQIAAAIRPILERLKKRGGPLFMWKGEPIIPDQLRSQWRERRGGTPWEHVSGVHVLRHSFASNLAAKGVDQRLIDKWMGHMTQEQRSRYSHLFPEEKTKAIEALG